jgi:hypothetical protein
MAFIADEEEQQSEVMGQNGQAPVLSGQTGAEGQAVGVQPGPSKSGSFTNLQKYIKSNAGNDVAMVDKIANTHKVDSPAVITPAQSQRSTSTATPGSGKVIDGNILPQLQSNSLNDLQGLTKGVYGGNGKQYGRGESILDSFLIQQGQGAQKQIDKIEDNYLNQVETPVGRGLQPVVQQSPVNTTSRGGATYGNVQQGTGSAHAAAAQPVSEQAVWAQQVKDEGFKQLKDLADKHGTKQKKTTKTTKTTQSTKPGTSGSMKTPYTYER